MVDLLLPVIVVVFYLVFTLLYPLCFPYSAQLRWFSPLISFSGITLTSDYISQLSTQSHCQIVCCSNAETLQLILFYLPACLSASLLLVTCLPVWPPFCLPTWKPCLSRSGCRSACNPTWTFASACPPLGPVRFVSFCFLWTRHCGGLDWGLGLCTLEVCIVDVGGLLDCWDIAWFVEE